MAKYDENPEIIYFNETKYKTMPEHIINTFLCHDIESSHISQPNNNYITLTTTAQQSTIIMII